MAVNNDNTTTTTKSPRRDKFSSLPHLEPRKSLHPKRTESCVQEDRGTASHCLFGFCCLIFGNEEFVAESAFFSVSWWKKETVMRVSGASGLPSLRVHLPNKRTPHLQVYVFFSGTLDTKPTPNGGLFRSVLLFFFFFFFFAGAGGDDAVCHIKGERPTKDVGGMRPETGMHVSNSHRIAYTTYTSIIGFSPFSDGQRGKHKKGSSSVPSGQQVGLLVGLGW
ncbi:hypothetical protein V8F33_012394 [Rhypophila sp. PSN 637]